MCVLLTVIALSILAEHTGSTGMSRRKYREENSVQSTVILTVGILDIADEVPMNQ